MDRKQEISQTMRALLEYARLAPSVHNTQPWRFSVKESTVSLLAAPNRFLEDGDPTQRELWISLGACFETLLQAAQGLGLKAEIESTQILSLSQPLATIRIISSTAKKPELLELLKNRHSYRGKMQTSQTPTALIENCHQVVADLPGISVEAMDDRVSISKVANFTYQGMSLALNNPAFGKELGELINYNWSSSRVGMPGFTLNKNAFGSVWEKWSVTHGVAVKQKALADRDKILDASSLIFIASKGDVPSFWFNAGRGYMRVAMEVTRAGLVHSTIAAPVEAASFHEDIEEILHTPNRIQAMIRIGTTTKMTRRHSPRLRVDELLT